VRPHPTVRLDAPDGCRVDRTDVPEGRTIVDATEAAKRACTAVGTIWSWHSRGLITAVGRVDGRPYFLLADVLAVEEKTRRRDRRKRMLAAMDH
jgi:hypothetical protein